MGRGCVWVFECVEDDGVFGFCVWLLVVAFESSVKWEEGCGLAFLDSIVVSIPACHAGDPGSIPGRGASLYPFS